MKAVYAERLNSSIGKGLWFRKLYVFLYVRIVCRIS